MTTFGNGSLSIKKSDAVGSPGKSVSTGYTQTYFATKAVAGAAGITLSSLTTPPEMAANGFTNPTLSTLQAANLLFNPNNLELVSSARGRLQYKLSYDLSSGLQINFLGFTALEGEIFTGTIRNIAQTGLKAVDASASPATGTLTAGTTDFNIGNPLPTNKYPTRQIGAYTIYKNGLLQARNTGNSSTVLDGNYYEVDNGSGSFTLVRFNFAEADDSSIIAIPNGLMSERPDGSMMAVIETLQGQVNTMAAYVAAVTGSSTTSILGSSPSNVDLKTFGDRVLAVEANRARIDQNNTWTAAQNLIGRVDGSFPTTTQVGEIIEVLFDGVATGGTGSQTNITTLPLTPGVWMVQAFAQLESTSTTAFTLNDSLGDLNLSATSGTSQGSPVGKGRTFLTLPNAAGAPGAGARFAMGIIPRQRIVVTSSVTYFLNGSAAYTGSAPTWEGVITAERIG